MKMDFTLLAIALAAPLYAGACMEEPASVESASSQMTFVACAPGSDASTRTVRQSDNSVFWSANEDIRIFCGSSASGRFTSTNSAPAARAEFTGSFQGTGNSSEYWAVYPYQETSVFDGSGVTVNIPAVQTAVEGTFADTEFPCIARTSGRNLEFKNVCGGARFTVSQSGITAITFSSNSGESLCGNAKVAFDESGAVALVSVSGGSDSVTMNAPDEGGFVPGKSYYISLLPETLENGFSVTLDKADEYGIYSTTKTVTVHSSMFGALENIDDSCVFRKRHKSSEFDENAIVATYGVVSDTHIDGVNTTPGNKFRNALRILGENVASSDKNGVDGILVAGDLINDPYRSASYYVQADYFKEIYESVYDPKKVPMVYTVGNHDVYQQWSGHTVADAQNISSRLGADYFLTDVDNDSRIARECRHCIVGNTHVLCVTPNSAMVNNDAGYDPLSVIWLDDQLRAITTKDPESYVLVLTHPMIHNTVYGSDLVLGSLAWYTSALTSVLEKYPQAVVFGGHLHFPLNDPRSVWQGDFTVFGTASVRYMAIENGGYEDMAGVTTMADKDEFSQGILLEFDANGNMRAKRMDFYHDAVIGEPLVFSYPKADKSHLQAYSHVRRRAANTAPVLRSLKAEVANTPAALKPVYAEFAAGEDDEFVHHYVLTVKKNGSTVKTLKILADFYRHPQKADMKTVWNRSLGSYAEGDYELVLTSYDSWGAQSNTLSTTFKVDGNYVPVETSLYVDLDFKGGISDAKNNVTITNNGATVAKTAVQHAGVTYNVDAVSLSATRNVLCQFKDIASFEQMQMMAMSGFSVEAFYVDKVRTTAVHGVVCATEQGGWGLAMRANGNPYFIVGEDQANTYKNIDAKSAISTTELTHVVGVYDPAIKKIKLYINGVLNGSANISASFYPGAGNTFNRFGLGTDTKNNASGIGDFPCSDMLITDVKIYKGILGDQDVADAYTAAVAALAN